jgi:hypothetical protein
MNIAIASSVLKQDKQILVAANFIGDRDFVEAELAADPRMGWKTLASQILRSICHGSR